MVWQSAELSGDANPARVPSQSAHYLNWWRNESSDIAEFYYAMVGSFIETQKSNPSGPRPSDPSAFSNRRFHSIFKPALTVIITLCATSMRANRSYHAIAHDCGYRSKP